MPVLQSSDPGTKEDERSETICRGVKDADPAGAAVRQGPLGPAGDRGGDGSDRAQTDETGGGTSCAGIREQGSTSNYFRTRQALLTGVVDGIIERELPEVGGALSLDSPAELVEALCKVFERITSVDRNVTTARLVLFMEASHNVDLREALSRGRAAMEALAVVALARLGARDPQTAAVAVAACFEGLLLHRIARHDQTDPRPIIALVVQAALIDGSPRDPR